MKIIHLADRLDRSDGVSSHLFSLTRTLKSHGAEQIIIAGGGNAHERFTAKGIPVMLISSFLHAERSFLNFSLAVKTLCKTAYGLKPDVLHSHSHYCANIARQASRLLGTKTVQTIHGLIPPAGRLKHFNADSYICLSKANASELLRSGKIRKHKLKIINQGIVISDFENNSVRFAGKCRVGAAMRLVHEKGPDVFIEAASGVSLAPETNTEFILAGEGPMKRELQELNRRLNAGVNFAGDVNDMGKFLSDTDIFVMPTRSADEGFPMALAEAAVSGCCVISAGFNSLREYFGDIRRFSPGDHETLSALIKESIKDKEASLKYSGKIRRRAMNIFDAEKSALQTLAVYREKI